MVRCEVVRARRADAEGTRRTLQEGGLLRHDVEVGRDGDDVLLPVSGCPVGLRTEVADLEPRAVRARSYQEHLPANLRPLAPRAFDQVGDILVVKVPPDLWDQRELVGEAMLRFKAGVRAVFHDHGVHGPWRIRRLERIAGEGGTQTTVQENGVALWVDAAQAYFSPRLGMERARVVASIRPGDVVLDLFGGVAPLGVQAARAGARVHSVDANPAACLLAVQNAQRNGVADLLQVHEGDARAVAMGLLERGMAPVDRLVMNLPHGAAGFLDLAPRLLRSGGVLHFHEIMDRSHADGRAAALAESLAGGRSDRVARRAVRTYSAQEDHFVFDVVRS